MFGVIILYIWQLVLCEDEKFKIRENIITTLLIHVKIGILITYGKHSHDGIVFGPIKLVIQLKALHFFINWNACTKQRNCPVMYMGVRCIDFASVSMRFFLLDVGTIQTVWCILVVSWCRRMHSRLIFLKYICL